jgi:hypothetical protein
MKLRRHGLSGRPAPSLNLPTFLQYSPIVLDFSTMIILWHLPFLSIYLSIYLSLSTRLYSPKDKDFCLVHLWLHSYGMEMEIEDTHKKCLFIKLNKYYSRMNI